MTRSYESGTNIWQWCRNFNPAWFFANDKERLELSVARVTKDAARAHALAAVDAALAAPAV
jgi:hypothetical protein